MHVPLRTLAATLVLTLVALAAGPTHAQDTGAADTTKTAPTLVQTLQEADGFGTLLRTLEASGLADTLQSDGPFTLFAPTDEAFAKLPEGALENLLKPTNESELQSILTFHVVPGALTAGAVRDRTDLETLHGSKIGVAVADGAVTLTGESKATIVRTNLEASNGVIHVIDTVLLPPVKTALRDSR